MNAFVGFLPILAAFAAATTPFDPAPGDPVVLKDLLHPPHGHPDPRVAAFVHAKATVKPDFGREHHAKFLLLVPTLGADLTGGVVSSGTPGGLHPHRVTFVDPVFPGEHLVELVGFADCTTWFALNATFWHPDLVGPTFKAAAFELDRHGNWVKHALLPGVVTPFTGFTFFDYLYFRLHTDLKPKLLEQLPSHPVTLALAGKLPKRVAPERVPPRPVELPVPSEPVLLDTALFKGERVDERLASVLPVTVLAKDHMGGTHTVRFLHVVPTLFSDLTGGFATPAGVAGDHPRPLPFTVPDLPEEHLVELVGFADCEKWFALHLTFWNPFLGKLTHRAAGFERNKDGHWVRHPLFHGPWHPTEKTVVDFVHDHAKAGTLPKVLEELPSHPLVHALHAKVH